MGLYQISVKEPSGHHICGFEYWVIANGSEIAKGNLKPGGPTDVNLKGHGSGDLYIRGPALKGYWDPANPKAGRNFAHRETIELTGQGEIEFLLEPSPDALGILPKKPCSGAQTFCSPEGCSIEIPPVPVQFRALNDPQNPNHPGYVFRCEFHDAMPLTRWIAVASGGNGERLWLPSGAVTLNIYFALNDGNNQPVPGTEQRQTATLRKGDQAMGATVIIMPKASNAHRELIDAPENFFNNQKSHSLEFTSPTEANQTAGQFLIDMRDSLEGYARQYCLALSGGVRGGSLVALYSDIYGFFGLTGT